MSLSFTSFPGCSPPELVQCITGTLIQPSGCQTPGQTLSPPRSHSIHTVPTFQRREQASGKLCSSLPRLQGRDTAIRTPLHLRSAGRAAVWGRRQGGQWRQRGQALGRSRWGTGEGPQFGEMVQSHNCRFTSFLLPYRDHTLSTGGVAVQPVQVKHYTFQYFKRG